MAQLYTYVSPQMRERLHAVAAENDRTIHKTIERAVREHVAHVQINVDPWNAGEKIKIFTRADDETIASVKARAIAENRTEWEVVHACIGESLSDQTS